jgi:hypothetical protein
MPILHSKHGADRRRRNFLRGADGIPPSFLEMGSDFDVLACEAHPSRPGLSSLLDDGHIMPAARQVDIRRRGADEGSIHLDVRTGGSGADMYVYVGRSW